ncbi:MAG: hypothetical protein HKP55_10085 [Gammaproteobacteria bacterium]|nr:hypothetical protein [Gammaproteobacteria bacterium]
MMKINSFLKIFDRELIEILALNAAGIAFLLVHFYAYSVEKALLVSPVISVSVFLGLIGVAQLLSKAFDLIEKGSSLLRS